MIRSTVSAASVDVSHDATEQENQKNPRRLNAFQPLNYTCKIVRWTHSRPPDFFMCLESAGIKGGPLGWRSNRTERNGGRSGSAEEHRMIPGMEMIGHMVESSLIQR
jgi:hypothetical protein